MDEFERKKTWKPMDFRDDRYNELLDEINAGIGKVYQKMKQESTTYGELREQIENYFYIKHHDKLEICEYAKKIMLEMLQKDTSSFEIKH